MLQVLNLLSWKTFAEFMHLSTVHAPCSAAVFKEVDEPLQLDMSELRLDDDFMGGSDGSCLLLKDKESFCRAAVPLLPESSDYSSGSGLGAYGYGNKMKRRLACPTSET
ncbi:hypothetical protein F3Y22_tig00109906pilonHSYRG00028 [Hibiscus syriacus]|uniref:Uncharacterized protein n=1 Tax=Hibiscus syriacus TaxID=106335 RepID=A0A6A3BU69_HIBSY|nr:hypothetical protein F3Y22_tig00109906pilonHSYRG00028 [Hibiscus syriacus]